MDGINKWFPQRFPMFPSGNDMETSLKLRFPVSLRLGGRKPETAKTA